jgi:hypothetical protein
VRIPLAIAILLLAGCAGPVAPGPVGPGPGQGAWTAWDGAYVAHGHRYGFVGVDEEGYGPAVPFTAVDAGGRVLWFRAAYDPSAPAGVHLSFAPGLEAWRPVVEPLLADGALLDSRGHVRVRVMELRADTLGADDWERVKAVLDHGLDTAREPRDRDPGMAAFDGGTEGIVSGTRSVALDRANDDGGGGWERVREQMARLGQWIAPGA